MDSRKPAPGVLALVALLMLAAGCGVASGGHRTPPGRAGVAAVALPPAVATSTAVGVPTSGAVRRRAVVGLGYRAGLPLPPAVLVLEFHDVVPAAVRAADPALSADPYVISATQLAADLDFLRREGFVTVTPDQVAGFVAGRLALPRRSVLLTFDDGLESFYEYALPALQARGMRATVFVIAGRVTAASGPYQPTRLSSMSWPELARVAATGLVSIDGHTFDLHTRRVVRVVLPGPASRIAADLTRANALLAAHLGRTPHAFAYPFGLSSPAYVAALRATGYRLAFVGGDRPVHRGDDPYRLTRFLVTPKRNLGLLLAYVGPRTGAGAGAETGAGTGAGAGPRTGAGAGAETGAGTLAPTAAAPSRHVVVSAGTGVRAGPAPSDNLGVRVEARPSACPPPAGVGTARCAAGPSPASAPQHLTS